MWTVIKFDKKNYHLLKEDIKNKIDNNCIVYRPKILIQKFKNNKLVNKEVDILNDYLFCFHEKLKEKNIDQKFKFLRGLKYFLKGYSEFQTDIKSFINKCKSSENENGYISKNIFEININSHYKFSSGPFVDKIFKIINFRKNKINILMGNLKTTVNKRKFLSGSV